MKKTLSAFSIMAVLIVGCQRDDKTPPVITMNGAVSTTIQIGNSYTDPGATAVDAKDGDLTSRIEITGGVNNLQSGTYTITYTVSDFFRKRKLFFPHGLCE